MGMHKGYYPCAELEERHAAGVRSWGAMALPLCLPNARQISQVTGR